MTPRQLHALRVLIQLYDHSHGSITPDDLWQAGGAAAATGAGLLLSNLMRQGLAIRHRGRRTPKDPGSDRYEPTEHGRRVVELEDENHRCCICRRWDETYFRCLDARTGLSGANDQGPLGWCPHWTPLATPPPSP